MAAVHHLHAGLDVLYMPDVVPKDRRAELFERLRAEASWHRPEMNLWGKKVRTRRDVAWHADEGFVYRYSGQEHAWRPWTPAMEELRAFAGPCNGVLLNFYRDGGDYISPHADDESDMIPGSPIVCISLGAPREFVLRHLDGTVFKLMLEDGSKVVMAGDTQRVSRHHIPKRAHIKDARISLTFRQCSRRR